jgi:hypothetical protein
VIVLSVCSWVNPRACEDSFLVVDTVKLWSVETRHAVSVRCVEGMRPNLLLIAELWLILLLINPEGISAHSGSCSDYRPDAPNDELAQYKPSEEWYSAPVRL